MHAHPIPRHQTLATLDVEGRYCAAAILADADPGRAAARRRLAARILSELLRGGESLLPGCQVDAGEATFCADLASRDRAVEFGRVAQGRLVRSGFPVAVGGDPTPVDRGRHCVYLTVPCGGPRGEE